MQNKMQYFAKNFFGFLSVCLLAVFPNFKVFFQQKLKEKI